MNLTIHRGSNEIGGSCVELRTDSTRILIDFGQPIVNSSGAQFDNSVMKKKSIEELIKLAVLPDIEGLYSDNSKINGILLSHSHIDHYGLLNFAHKDIPVYLGEATGDIIEINNIFQRQTIKFNHPVYFQRNVKFEIGDISITAFSADHSAFDSYSFLIESGDKRIFYSGDFRSHGRKEKVYRYFLHNTPKNIDYLILEGTSISKQKSISELQLEVQLTRIFKSSTNGCYVWASAQNIDRMVSIFKACLSSKKTLIVDLYSVNVLNILSKYGSFPTPLKGYSNMKVLFIPYLLNKLIRNNRMDLVEPFEKYEIQTNQISNAPEKYIMLFRPSMKTEINEIAWSGGQLVYSMWEGYKQKQDSMEFLNYFTSQNFEIIDLHSSGHADEATLVEFVNAINPKYIIPIHTFHKNQYPSVFSQEVKILNDNELLEI
ncbi:MAG: MBL fold metallo-hydrolase [Candidatus Kapabacteria bacterium]|nr:MBL fold metallo-hydrolase [Candidatus Kapabacteria bacterium]